MVEGKTLLVLFLCACCHSFRLQHGGQTRCGKAWTPQRKHASHVQSCCRPGDGLSSGGQAEGLQSKRQEVGHSLEAAPSSRAPSRPAFFLSRLAAGLQSWSRTLHLSWKSFQQDV